MKYQIRNLPAFYFVALALSVLLAAACLLHYFAQTRILASQAHSRSLDAVSTASLLCGVDIDGSFKYLDGGKGADTPSFLSSSIRLTNTSNTAILPGQSIKLGLRWGGTPDRPEQYRIDIPNELRPGEMLEFSAMTSLHQWNIPNQFIALELMREGDFWCSDYGGRKLNIAKQGNNDAPDLIVEKK